MKAPSSEEQVRAAALKRLEVLVCLDPSASRLDMSMLDQIWKIFVMMMWSSAPFQMHSRRKPRRP